MCKVQSTRYVGGEVGGAVDDVVGCGYVDEERLGGRDEAGLEGSAVLLMLGWLRYG